MLLRISDFYAELYLSSDQWNNHSDSKASQVISVKSTEYSAVVYMNDWPIYLWISLDKYDTMWIMCSDV